MRLSVLNNRTMWEASADSSPREFNEIGFRASQATSQAMDSNGNLFFGLERPLGIACWDSSRPYNEQNIRVVAQNDQTLQFISGLKVIRNKLGEEELWVLSDRFQVRIGPQIACLTRANGHAKPKCPFIVSPR